VTQANAIHLSLNVLVFQLFSQLRAWASHLGVRILAIFADTGFGVGVDTDPNGILYCVLASVDRTMIDICAIRSLDKN
jgi:hypothetical protein